MKNRFNAYFEKLEKFSNRELQNSAEKLVRTEKENLAHLIAHISEISRRKAHLELGYKNLFDYCTKHLGISEGAAYLRMQVANFCRRFHEILEWLSRNQISLTVAGLLSACVTEENCSIILSDCQRKTKHEVEEYLVALRPKPIFKPMIRRKAVKKVIERAPQKSPGTVQPACPEVFNFRFSADRAFKEKLVRLAQVLGIENAQNNMQEVLEKALELALDRKDPKKKLERRIKRERLRERGKSSPAEENSESSMKRSRYIPDRVRELVLERASYCCEYRGPDGLQCTQRTGLAIDHIKPFARGGSNCKSNLRALCRQHNCFQEERDFGEEFVREKIKC